MPTPYNVCNGTAGSGSAVLQVTAGTGTGTPTGTTAGDAIVVLAWSVAAPLSCADSQGNQYSLILTTATPQLAFFLATEGPTGGATIPLVASTDWIAVTYSGSGSAKNLIARGCAGITPGQTVDMSNSASGTGTAPNSGASGTLTTASEWIIGGIVNANAGGVPTAPSFGTVLSNQNASNDILSIFDKTQASTTSHSANATIVSAAWSAGIITIPIGELNGGQVTFNNAICFSVASGAPGGSGNVTFPLNLSFAQSGGGGGPTPQLVNTWSSKELSSYGLQPIPVANNTGNTLVAFVGWNGASVNPVANLADDQHNHWEHMGTSSSSGDSRCAIWVAPNANAAEIVSVGLSWFAQGLTVLICEFSGFPVWAQLDFVQTGFVNAGTVLNMSYTPTQPDFVFTVLCQDNNSATITKTGMNANLGTVSINDPSGAGGPADTGIIAYWTQINGTGTRTPSWTSSASNGMSAVIVGIKQSPTPPAQPNPNWPSVSVQMAFGYQPGDPTQMPVWTDVTTRARANDGSSVIDASRGREYESAGTEAGDLTVQLNNADGALNPSNTSSPYYPNVLQGTPLRVRASWNNKTYPVGFGYTERLPQTFPDPQWGYVPIEAPDGFSAMSNSVLPSALAGELLADSPYAYWNCGDTYLQDAADGLPLSNLSRTNLRPMTCLDSIYVNGQGNLLTRFLQTGLAWQQQTVGQSGVDNANGSNGSGLTGDPTAAAIGATDFSGGNATNRGPGAFYYAPDLPQPGTTGLTVEFWAMIPGISNGSRYQELLRISGPANNYYVGAGGSASNAFARGARFLVRVNPGPAGTQGQDWVYIDVADFEGNDFGTGVQGLITNNQPHHFVFAITESLGGGNNYKIQFWLDGVLKSTTFSTGVNVENDWNYVGVGGVMHNDGGIAYGYNYTFGHLALFKGALTNARVQAHYNAAFTGCAGDDVVTRIARLMLWGNFGMPRAAGPTDPNPLLGPADQISGSSVVDAAGTVETTDNGLLFADGWGNITYWPRQFMVNKPVKWTLGDNPSAGEIPYQPSEAYDYDNTFVNNSITSQQQVSSGANGVLVTVEDQTSEKQYFTRSGLSETIETTSSEDAYDQANWLLQKYKQPELRVQSVVIEPSSHPAAWPMALGVEQGDIVQLNRRPLGAAVYSQQYIVQKVSHKSGPDSWQVTLNMIPYDIEASVLQCDVSGNDTLGSNGIGW